MKTFMTTAAIIAALTMPGLAQTESTKGEASGNVKSTTMGDKGPNAKGSEASGMKAGASTAMQPEMRKNSITGSKGGQAENTGSGAAGTASSPNNASGGSDNANASGGNGNSGSDSGAGGAAGNGK